MLDGEWLLNLNLWLLAGLVVLNIPVYMMVGWVVFDDWRGFLSSFTKSGRQGQDRYDLMDDARDFDGEAAGAGLEILGFLIVCGAAVAGEYYLINQYFG